MALKQSITTIHGIELPQSYVRIDEQSGNKQQVSIRVRYYADEQKANQYPGVEEKVYIFEPSIANDAPNFIKQGYEYLKTLPEFSSAIDA